LFAGSDTGAERLAVAYTVFGSCHRQGVDPLAWATDIIAKLQDGWPLSRLEELLPDRWSHPVLTPIREAPEARCRDARSDGLSADSTAAARMVASV
jgi:hypothetical protein